MTSKGVPRRAGNSKAFTECVVRPVSACCILTPIYVLSWNHYQ